MNLFRATLLIQAIHASAECQPIGPGYFLYREPLRGILWLEINSINHIVLYPRGSGSIIGIEPGSSIRQ